MITCDGRFTVIDGEMITDLVGVIYTDQPVPQTYPADQPFLRTLPADAADGVDRIVTAVPSDELAGAELDPNDWLR